MITVQIAKFDNGRPFVVITDSDEFQRVEPPGYSRDVRRAIEVDGRYYLLAPDCPDEGLAEWSESTPELAAKDESILSARALLTTEQLAALGLSEVKTRAEQIAQKIIDDAEAEARRVGAERVKEETR